MESIRRINAQAVFALGLLVFTSVYASQILQLGMPFSDSVEPGASFLPIVLAAVMYVSGLRILVGELRAGSAKQADARIRSETVPWLSVLGPGAVILATTVFTASLPWVGYGLSAALYTFAVALFFNYEESGRLIRSALLALATAVAITAFGWLFFVRLFGLYLPTWSL